MLHHASAVEEVKKPTSDVCLPGASSTLGGTYLLIQQRNGILLYVRVTRIHSSLQQALVEYLLGARDDSRFQEVNRALDNK
jgi:hypothetical protein